MATDSGAPDPDGLARSLTLLLDGGLASGSLDADPQPPSPPATPQHNSWPRDWGAPQHPAGTELPPDVPAFAVNSRRTLA